MEGGYVSCRKPISGRCQPGCTRVSAKKCAPRPTYESFILQGGDEDSIEFHNQYLKAGMDPRPRDEDRWGILPQHDLYDRRLEAAQRRKIFPPTSDPQKVEDNDVTGRLLKAYRQKAAAEKRRKQLEYQLATTEAEERVLTSRLPEDPLDPRGGAYKKYTTRRFARAPTPPPVRPPPVQYAKYTGPRRNCAYNSPCVVAGKHDWQLRGPGNYICVHCDCYFDDR